MTAANSSKLSDGAAAMVLHTTCIPSCIVYKYSINTTRYVL